MSQETRDAYLWLDSIMRHHFTDADWATLDSLRNLDSIRLIAKYLYALSDYDPVLLQEYGRDAPNLQPRYTGKPAAMIGYLERVVGTGLRDSYANYLGSCSYILHVRVSGVRRDSSVEESSYWPLVCIEATIIDTIKGQHLLTDHCEDSSKLGNTCFHFQYSAGWSKTGSDMNPFAMVGTKLVFWPDAMGWDAVVPGGEYIVFLTTVYEDYNGTSSFFGIWPIYGWCRRNLPCEEWNRIRSEK